MAVALAAAAGCWSAQPPVASATALRIVCLGDSITDGQTYALLTQQALREAGRPVPVMIGAGIGADNAQGMLKRLDRDVLAYAPNLVVVCTGINDQALTVAEYEVALRAIYDRLKRAGVPVLVLTLTTLAPRHASARPKLAQFDAVLRRLAKEYGYALADVNRRLQEAMDRGEMLHEPDGAHLNLAGYRAMARAVLDALGHADVAVPGQIDPPVLPGVIREWRLQAALAAEPLTEDGVRALAPDATWIALCLPQERPVTNNWWMDQERRRGVAVELQRELGEAPRFQGIATFDSPIARKAWLHTGADLKTVWLNGARVYAATAEFRGWHPGRERVAIALQAGANSLVIESGRAFFLAVTDERPDLERVADAPAAENAPPRIACVGDSLTSGFQMEHPERDAYPAQLARRLGEMVEVRAFAVPGRTALKSSDLSLWREPVFTNALAWLPEAVILCLGANDSFPPIWAKHGSAFEADLKAMVEQFKALPSHPRIWLALPTPMFLGEPGKVQLAILADGVQPAIRRVAAVTGAGVIDWYTPLRDRRDAFMPDKVHPLPAAAECMAEAAWQALRNARLVGPPGHVSP